MNNRNVRSTHLRRVFSLLVLGGAVLTTQTATGTLAGEEELTLRVQDAIGAPGGMVS